MNENKWTQEAFGALSEIAEEILVSNINDLKYVEIWITGSSVESKNTSLQLCMELTFSDDGTEKIRYSIPEDIQPEVEESPEKMLEFATGYVAQHMMKQIFRIKLNNKDNGSTE